MGTINSSQKEKKEMQVSFSCSYLFASLCIAEVIHRYKAKVLFNKLKKNQNGWVFVDALIGVVILITALTALMTMYTQSTKGTIYNRNYNNALFVAQQKLEDIKQYEGTSTIKSLPTSVTAPENVTLDKIDYKIVINPLTVTESLDSHIYPYEATVSWPASSPTSSVKIAAYYLSN